MFNKVFFAQSYFTPMSKISKLFEYSGNNYRENLFLGKRYYMLNPLAH